MPSPGAENRALPGIVRDRKQRVIPRKDYVRLGATENQRRPGEFFRAPCGLRAAKGRDGGLLSDDLLRRSRIPKQGGIADVENFGFTDASVR